MYSGPEHAWYRLFGYNKARMIKKIFWNYDLYENINHEIAILELSSPYGTKHVDFKNTLGYTADNYDSDKSGL